MLKSSCGMIVSGLHACAKVSISLRLRVCATCSTFCMCWVPARSKSHAARINSYCDLGIATYCSDVGLPADLKCCESVGDVC